MIRMTACRPSDRAAERYISGCAALLVELPSSSRSLCRRRGDRVFRARQRPHVGSSLRLNDRLEFASGHPIDPESAGQIPANMIGRFLDDGDLRKLEGMLLKKEAAGPIGETSAGRKA